MPENSSWLAYWSLASPVAGEVWVAASELGLFMIGLDEQEESFLGRCSGQHPGRIFASRSRVSEPLRQLDGYFRHRRRKLSLPLDRRGLSGLHWRLMDEIRCIPYGSVASYGEIARRIGLPGGARAVGQAMGRNRTPIFLPCHRVIASGGGLGGFGSGPAIKESLLRLEGWIPQ